jgi:uncharacterized membrane protein YidH (DUF202 family)
MEPTSLLLAATTAFSALKKGFAVAIGRWMNAVNDLEEHHKKERKKYGSIEAEALETWAALRKAKAQEEELRLYIIAHYGMDAWQQIIRMQGRIRKQRAEEAKRRKQQREDILIWSGVVAIAILVLLFLIALLSRIFP